MLDVETYETKKKDISFIEWLVVNLHKGRSRPWIYLCAETQNSGGRRGEEEDEEEEERWLIIAAGLF